MGEAYDDYLNWMSDSHSYETDYECAGFISIRRGAWLRYADRIQRGTEIPADASMLRRVLLGSSALRGPSMFDRRQ